MIQKGVLKRIGKGKFAIGSGKIYIPEVSSKMKSLYMKLKKKFPYLNICIWHTSVFNEFMIHQPNKFYYLVEVEKDATNSVFYFLKEFKYAVFHQPNEDLLDNYILFEKEAIIVKSLVSEAPLQNIKGVATASIEKMLVDIFCDDIIFSAQQGSELHTIFKEVFNKYTLNQSKMIRYADRRSQKENLIKFLKITTNLRQ